MLKLNKHLVLDEKAVKAPNLCDRFDETDLAAIGNWVFDGYSADKQTRKKWEDRTEAALDLAMQLQKDKSFPWPNCSNIKFPLVTIGAMQFHAKAYPSIISGPDIVKCRVIGSDPNGDLTKRADRVSTHMSYQVMEEDTAWEEQHDRMLLIVPIVGCAFVKTYFNPKVNHNVSELVMARDFVINYYAKDIDSCSRKTHVIPLSRNAIRERVLSEIYRDVLDEAWYQQPAQVQVNEQTSRSNKRKGEEPPYQPDEMTEFRCLEMHCDVDLDGDGYAEPYIIVVEETSKSVLRIVSRINRYSDITKVENGTYKGDVVSVRAEEYFTKYSFIPSPDGGIYDVGFGVLLGPLNESVDSLINQLVDAGTMANTAGGFLGRGAKIRGGVYTFAPFGWNRVDSTGDDLRKSIFPLPVREPSPTLFQLLSLLINYTNRISGATDAVVGENPGQNTPAETNRSMIEMGMKIYSAIFKRVWRSMKEEFRKLYILNTQNFHGDFGDGDGKVTHIDYTGNPNTIVPSADPDITSEQQAAQQAMTVKQMAMSTPGYDLEAVERNVLKALKIKDINHLFPGPKSPKATPPPQDPKLQIAQMKMQLQQGQLQFDQQKFMAELQDEQRLTTAKIAELEAKAEMELEQANGVQAGQQLAQFDAYLGLLKLHNEHLTKQMTNLMDTRNAQLDRQHELQLAHIAANAKPDSGAVGPVAAGPSDGVSAGMGQGAA